MSLLLPKEVTEEFAVCVAVEMEKVDTEELGVCQELPTTGLGVGIWEIFGVGKARKRVLGDFGGTFGGFSSGAGVSKGAASGTTGDFPV